MRPLRGVDGSSADRWHPDRPDSQRLWLGIYRSARWSDRFVGHPLKPTADHTDLRRRMVAWATHLASSRSRPTNRLE